MSDFIKREDAKLRIFEYGVKHRDDWSIASACENLERQMNAIPAADVVERKKGKWIWDDEGYHCSECFFHAYGNTLECLDGTYAFCPNCGADMREERRKD